MTKKIKKNKGITLIALVVTIVVLMILAAISVGALTGDNGTIGKSQNAKRDAEKSEEREKIELVTVQTAEKDVYGEITNDSKGTLIDNLDANIGKGKYTLNEDEEKFTVIYDKTGNSYDIYKDLSIANAGTVKFEYKKPVWTNENVIATASTDQKGVIIQTSKDGQIWESTSSQTYTENGKMYVRFTNNNGDTNKSRATGNIWNIDKTKPIVTLVTGTTNTITLKATDEASGIIGYTVTTSTTVPTSFTPCANTKSLSATVEDLKQGTKYYAWVLDAAGNISAQSDNSQITTPKVPDLIADSTDPTQKPNITFKYNPDPKDGWTNKNVDVTVSTTITGYEIQTSKDNSKWTTTNIQTFTDNGTIYVRLIDSTNQYGGTATGNIAHIDKTDPSVAGITLSGAGTFTSGPTIKATVTHSDTGGSGISIANSKWIINTSSAALGTNAASYTGGAFSSNGQTVSKTLTSAGDYYLHVLTADTAGNAKETISKVIKLAVNVHKHTGSSTSGGGCYTSPVYHTHVDGCYQKATCQGDYDSNAYSTGKGRGMHDCTEGYEEGVDIWHVSTRCPHGIEFSGTAYHCDCCGYVWKAHYEHTYSTGTIICGKSTSTIERYNLGCGKTETSEYVLSY